MVDGDLNNLFSAQGGVAGIDNVFLKNMHLYTEAGKRKRSDNWLRPDYHLDTDKKYEDMSISDLLYGMQGVYETLIKRNIPELPASAYLDHMRFVKLKSTTGAFSAKQLARYDYKVVTRVLEGKIPHFVGGDEGAIQACLSAEHMASVIEASQPLPTGNPGSRRRNRRRGGGGGGPRFNKPEGQDSNFTSYCLNWNFTVCNLGEECNRKHQCKHCQGNHKAKNCSLDRNNQQNQQA